tara:strand:+ start:419 stop:961 length:543 start_codon:yes stop_codon:yes gene_type:complete
MKNKFIIGLSSLALLVVLYIININQQKNYQSSTNKLFDINVNQINKILIQSRGEAIEISRADTSWAIAGNDTLSIKQELLTSFFDRVLNLESERVMTKNEQKWPTYNVDDSLGTHLALVDFNENTIGYYVFGRSSSDYSRCYVRINESPAVHLTNQNVMYNLQTRPQHWGEVLKEELPTP